MNNIYKDSLEWDVHTWKNAVNFWEDIISKENVNLKIGLEVGARNGGMSLFFAYKYGSEMICSDKGLPSFFSLQLHSNYKIKNLVSYEDIDILNIPFESNYFDFIVFKSVLGGLGSRDNLFNQKIAISELHRVLKRGGYLFFAENSKASMLHQFFRKYFIPWGKSWRYLSLNELNKLLHIFNMVNLKSCGFFASFFPNSKITSHLVSNFDRLLFFIPSNMKYVLYGFAVK